MKKWIVLFSVGIYLLLINLDLTIVNLALAEFSKAFNATIEQIQLVIVSYLAAAAACFCLSGVLADRYGKKRIFMLGGLLFVLSSLYIGAFAYSIEAIIVARFIQGIGFSATLGLAIILIGNAFPPEQKGFAVGTAAAISGIGLALGPALGGLILQLCGWKTIFLLNVPLGLLSLVLTAWYVNGDDPKERSIHTFDVLGMLLYLLGLSCLIVLSNALNLLTSIQIGLLTIVSAVSIMLFVRHSLRVQAPLINLSLLKNRIYLTIVSIRIIFNWVMASFLFVFPLFMQNILNYSSIRTGLWMLCMTACIFVISPITGKIIDRYGFQLPIFTGISLLLVSCIAFLKLNVDLSMVFFVTGLVSFGLANGALTVATINGAISQVSPQYTGTAIGLLYTLSMIGAMFGVALSGLILSKVGEFELARHLAVTREVFTPVQLQSLRGLVNASQNLTNMAETFAGHLIDSVRPLINTSFITGMRALMLFNASLVATAFGLSILLFKHQKTQSPQQYSEYLEGATSCNLNS